MTTGAIAAMLSTILYSRRFFPYYVYNIIGGLDEEGRTRGGASWARVHPECEGASQAILPRSTFSDNSGDERM